MERPILFSAPMVRAILEGRKTQTRRIVKPQPTGPACDLDWKGDHLNATGTQLSPFGAPGDRLWVKETWKPDPAFGYTDRDCPSSIMEGTNILYRATLPEDHPKATWLKWRPSLFMRRWMSRITLEIVNVRVERLNEISEEDALAEGCGTAIEGGYPTRAIIMPNEIPATRNYCRLWESLNGEGSWASNPWVWVIEFRRAA